MNLNFELLQYYQFKRVIKRKERNIIFAECERLGLPVEKYMIAKQYATEVSALPALGEFLSLPYAEMDMFDVDREFLDKFSLALMKKHKIVPVSVDKNGILLLAVGKPLDFVAMSTIATIYTGKIDYAYVPSVQIDVFIDSIAAVLSTTSALESLQKDKDQALVEQATASDIEIML
ncbi:MAG: hypothetical protein GX802_04985, partial [Clostridiales bacterium]|nr:hypothetical protein [Clostridiales bacterium]